MKTTLISVPCVIGKKTIYVSATCEYDKYGETVKYPCGQDTRFGKRLAKQFADDNVKRHVENCIACRTVLGESNAHYMNLDEVAALFCKSIDGRESHPSSSRWNSNRTSKLRSEDGILTHFSTIEAIRTYDGSVIRNTQCWAEGFAKCPSMDAKYSLPLSTISSFASNKEMRSIKVLEVSKEWNEVLFTITREAERKEWNHEKNEYNTSTYEVLDYYLFGHDENLPYLVKLIGTPQTLKDAQASMVPYQVQGAMKLTNVKRQGDLYFVPIPSKPLDFLEIANAKEHKDKDTMFYRLVSHMKISNIDKQRYTFVNSIDESGYGDERKVNGMKIERKLYRPAIPMKDRERPERGIVPTNHTADEMGEILYDRTGKLHVVRGVVRHANRQHASLNLGRRWHIAIQNTVERTWNVPRRGTGGGGD